MTGEADRYARVHAILNEARERPADQRNEFLDEACGEDSSLRAEVLELLEVGEAETSDAFAETSIAGARDALGKVIEGLAAPWLPDKIGDYEILGQLGQGGMGVVYEARQESPHRRVAIKLLHPMHATPERLRRFRQEAELLGRLQHPCIAQIFEASTYDIGRGPQPFFAMELVDGVDIRTHCDRHGLERAERIELLARVADAVHYAHERGVIHRDLKPDNVLVGPHGNPRVLDFGIAHASSHAAALSTVVTNDGQLVGTLAYMAPEQLDRSTDEVSPKIDVYALGALGYELLVGRPPRDIEDLSISKAITLLTRTDAPRASVFDTSLRGDLETILGKALESDPARRYATAAAFGGDLRRFLSNQPIEARPPTRLYLVRKFSIRHRGLVAGMVMTTLTLIAGASVALLFAKRAEAQRDLATLNEERAVASRNQALNAILQSAQTLVESGRGRDAVEQLRLIPESSRGIAWRFVDRAVPVILDAPRGKWRFLDEVNLVAAVEGRVLTYSLTEHRVTGESFTKDGILHLGGPSRGGLVPARTADETLLLDLKRESIVERSPKYLKKELLDGTPHAWVYREPEVSRDGRTVLWYTGFHEAEVRVDGEVVRSFTRLDANESVSLSPDGQTLVQNRSDEVAVIDVATGELRLRHPIEPGTLATGCAVRDGVLLVNGPRSVANTHERRVWHRLALPEPGGAIEVARPFEAGYVATNTGIEAHYHFEHTEDGFVAAVYKEYGAFFFETSTGAPLELEGLIDRDRDGYFEFPDAGASEIEFSPSGERVAVNSVYAQTRIVELSPERSAESYDPRAIKMRGHMAPVNGLPTWLYHMAVSNDGSLVASSAPMDPRVRVWDTRTGEELASLERDAVDPGSWDALMAFSRDDERLILTTTIHGKNTSVVDWNMLTGEVAVSKSLGVGERHHLRLLDEFLRVLDPADRARLCQHGQMLGDRALVAYHPAKPAFWDLPHPPEGTRWGYVPGYEELASGASVHPTERRVAVVRDDQNAEREGLLTIADADSGEVLVERELPYLPWCVAYSPDASVIAIGTNPGRLLLYETEGYTLQLDLAAHDSFVYSMAWTPDGTRLVTASGDTTLGVWDSRTLAATRLEEDHWQALRAEMELRADLADAYGNLDGAEREAARIVLIGRANGG